MSLPETAPLLSARGLGFGYGAQPVFAGVDLSIAAGEIVCILGASGCGKSTLLRCLAGLVSPATGACVSGQGQAVGAAGQRGMVFQSPTLLPWLNVAENVGFGLDFACRPREAAARRRQRVAAALAQVGLAGVARARVSTLSGGMAQRVALARALARDPAILFLDEPFSALDAVTRESMQDLLVDLVGSRGGAALLITHDLDEALRVADRVLLLAAPGGGAPARLLGPWQPEGRAPRLHRSAALNQLRETLLYHLAQPDMPWYPTL